MPNQQNTGPGIDAIRTRGSVAALEPALGLNIPYEWWPAAATLKGLEAAGFGWVQVAAPPVGMLADPRHGVRHAAALRQALEVTSLNVVLHGPTNLQLGSALHYRAFESLLEYAHQIGATHVVYHALDFARRGTESTEEERALRRLARSAEALGLTVCLENLCPVYPGRSSVCHDPLSVRDLVRRLDTPGLRHAAGRRARQRRRRLHGRRDRDADRAGARRRAASSTCTTTSAPACTARAARCSIPCNSTSTFPRAAATCRGTRSARRSAATRHR